MATYKVIQDIEAEDKLLGPLTLKQFIFAAIAAGFTFVAFILVSKLGNLLFAIPVLPFILVPAVLAAPIGRDQPTDIWLAARIRFLIKPRKRVWDQSGMKNLVTITAPKKIEKVYTNGLNEQEVRSRLKALADTIDSRGWAVKNVDINMYGTPAYATAGGGYDDRLINPASLPQTVPEIDITAADDIMDATSNPIAQHFESLVQEASMAQKNAALERMQSAMAQAPQTPQAPIDPWFMHQPDPSQVAPGQAMFTHQTVAPATNTPQTNDSFLQTKPVAPTSADEQALLEKIKDKKAHEPHGWAHHKTIKTPAELATEKKEKQKHTAEKQTQAVTPPKDPAIVDLANTNDLSVASVAHMANRKPHNDNNEVVVKLR